VLELELARDERCARGEETGKPERSERSRRLLSAEERVARHVCVSSCSVACYACGITDDVSEGMYVWMYGVDVDGLVKERTGVECWRRDQNWLVYLNRIPFATWSWL
jgi:hypothetical protein